MTNRKESSEDRRERLRQDELKNNPTGALNDAINKANNPSPDLSSHSWKETGLLILALAVGFIVYQLFF